MKGGMRSNAGRPGWHSTTSAAHQIDIRHLHRNGYLVCRRVLRWGWPSGSTIELEAKPESVRLAYRYKGRDGTWHDVNQQVVVTYTNCNFGSKRPWFLCPKCQRRIAILYLWYIPECRKCAHLVYASQSEDAFNRSWRRTTKLETRLAGGKEKWNFIRPKGMHEATFERLKRAYVFEQIRRDEALIAYAGRMGLLD